MPVEGLVEGGACWDPAPYWEPRLAFSLSFLHHSWAAELGQESRALGPVSSSQGSEGTSKQPFGFTVQVGLPPAPP